MSYALSAWLLVHAAYKAIGYRPAKDGLNAHVDPTRRRFLKWLGTGVVGTAVFSIVDPVGLLTRSFNARNGEEGTNDTGTDFAAYYTVTGRIPSYGLVNLPA